MGELLALISGAFLVGFAAQTHCVGMCGPVIGILGINNSYKRIPAAILYNLGRISTYTFLGIVGGLIATTISDISHVQFTIRMIAGAIMIFIGLQLLGLPQFLSFIERPFQLIWKPIQKFAQRFFPIKTALGTYTVGFIWGFLPCGAVYGPLAVAMGTGSVLKSAAIMFAFGLGTLPMMLGLAIFGNYIGRFFAKRSVRAVAGILVLAMSVYYLATIALPSNVSKKALKEDQRTEKVRSGETSATESLKELSQMSHDHGHGHGDEHKMGNGDGDHSAMEMHPNEMDHSNMDSMDHSSMDLKEAMPSSSETPQNDQ